MIDEKVRILVVDDVEINRVILEEILADSYMIEQAEDGMEALSLMVNAEVKPSLLLLDIMMPNMSGFDVLNFMKSQPLLHKIPVIFITAADQEREALQAGAVDYISKPFEPDIVKLRVANQIELMQYRERLESMVEQKANELIATKEHFLDTLANLIEYRSLESGQHVKRTRELARILVNQLLQNGSGYAGGLMDSKPGAMLKAVSLHDVGKIGIPDNILLKPGKLTPEEFAVIETHTVIGGQIIKTLLDQDEDNYLMHCYDICRHHHERWDGRGYPDRLAGTDIPLSARIVAVVDVYDALISERCYKKAMPHEQAIDIIKQGSGTQFDPEIVKALLEVEGKFKKQAHDS